jgi:hypothetical protein
MRAVSGVKAAIPPEPAANLVFAGKFGAFARYISVSPLLVTPLRFRRRPMSPAEWYATAGPSKSYLGRLAVECLETAKRFEHLHDC